MMSPFEMVFPEYYGSSMYAHEDGNGFCFYFGAGITPYNNDNYFIERGYVTYQYSPERMNMQTAKFIYETNT